MTFDFPAIAEAAKAERERRNHAWRDMLAQGKCRREQVEADLMLWLEIEIYARQCAGEADARRYGLPRSFAALAKTARTTLDRVVQRSSWDDPVAGRKIVELFPLTHWLEICALWAAPVPREPELQLEKAA